MYCLLFHLCYHNVVACSNLAYSSICVWYSDFVCYYNFVWSCSFVCYSHFTCYTNLVCFESGMRFYALYVFRTSLCIRIYCVIRLARVARFYYESQSLNILRSIRSIRAFIVARLLYDLVFFVLCTRLVFYSISVYEYICCGLYESGMLVEFSTVFRFSVLSQFRALF